MTEKKRGFSLSFFLILSCLEKKRNVLWISLEVHSLCFAFLSFAFAFVLLLLLLCFSTFYFFFVSLGVNRERSLGTALRLREEKSKRKKVNRLYFVLPWSPVLGNEADTKVVFLFLSFVAFSFWEY